MGSELASAGTLWPLHFLSPSKADEVCAVYGKDPVPCWKAHDKERKDALYALSLFFFGTGLVFTIKEL